MPLSLLCVTAMACGRIGYEPSNSNDGGAVGDGQVLTVDASSRDDAADFDATLGACAFDFCALHEDGTTSEYSSFELDTGTLSVESSAGLRGSSFGLVAQVSGASIAVANLTVPTPTSEIRIRLYFDSSALLLTSADNVTLLRIHEEDHPQIIASVSLSGSSGLGESLVLKASAGYRFSSTTGSLAVVISANVLPEAHFLEVHLVRGGEPDVADGSMEVFLDGVSVGSNNEIPSYVSFATLNRLSIGPRSSNDTAMGELLLDEVVGTIDNAAVLGP